VGTSANISAGIRIDGTAGDDDLTGTPADEEIHGGAGDDLLKGGSGNDTLLGDDGFDLLMGEDGNDSLDGGAGLNLLSGGAGDDHYEIRNRTDLVGDTGGHDSGTIHVDWYKTTADIEDWTWAPGVQKLPYWIDALTFSGVPFLDGMIGSSRIINYAFAQTPPSFFDDTDKDGFQAFNLAQKTYTRSVLSYIESVLNLRFVETTNTEGTDTIVFANNKQDDSSGYATSLWPGKPNTKVLVANYDRALDPSLDKGAELMRVLAHEIGHALGLKHPFADEDSVGNSGPGPYLPLAEDNVRNTVMSYTGIEPDPGKYSPLDIAALQYLYGPSSAYHSGDTRYTIGRDALMIGDGSGKDTIDGSAQTQDLTLSLEAGVWSHVGPQAERITARGQITIDIGSVIENAIGGSGNDHIEGNATSNKISGGAGNDVLRGAGGSDTIDGDAGLDTAVFSGARADYKLQQSMGSVFVLDTTGGEGMDVLNGIERVVFGDGALAFDIDGTAGKTYQLYAAAFDRQPDLGGLGFWIDAMDRGASLVEVATEFTKSIEFAVLYGATRTAEHFLDKVYEHMLHRAPDPGGYAYWLKVMQNGATEGQVLAGISGSNELHDLLIGQMQKGIDYLPFAA
jgi:hypothetical protein